MVSICGRCINESHVFVVVSGGFSGFCLWLDYHLRNGAVLQFRAIQRLGMDHVREEFYRLLKEALSQVLLNLRWFYLIYIVFGETRFLTATRFLFELDLFNSLCCFQVDGWKGSSETCFTWTCIAKAPASP